jgi:hypothetical protein
MCFIEMSVIPLHNSLRDGPSSHRVVDSSERSFAGGEANDIKYCYERDQ